MPSVLVQVLLAVFQLLIEGLRYLRAREEKEKEASRAKIKEIHSAVKANGRDALHRVFTRPRVLDPADTDSPVSGNRVDSGSLGVSDRDPGRADK